MPRVSPRVKLMQEFDSLLIRLAFEGRENSRDFKEFLESQAHLSDSRFLNERIITDKCKAMNNMLWRYNDDQFRQEVRMKKVSFARLVDKLNEKYIFQNNSRNPQAETWIQVMTVMGVLGFAGNGASVSNHDN